jgi:predicted nucleic acid-binding protein
MGDISTNDWNAARPDFLKDYRHRFKKTQISKDVIDKAISLLNQYPLRGYDSVQLASALLIHDLLQRHRKVSLTFVCADTLLCNTASGEGLNVENPMSHP